MTNFKTLKDFESNDESVDLLMEVRKEGIKWVKELPHLITKDDWFNFFNITAEDLK